MSNKKNWQQIFKTNIKDTIVYATAYIDFRVRFLLEMAYNNANLFASDQ